MVNLGEAGRHRGKKNQGRNKRKEVWGVGKKDKGRSMKTNIPVDTKVANGNPLNLTLPPAHTCTHFCLNTSRFRASDWMGWMVRL